MSTPEDVESANRSTGESLFAAAADGAKSVLLSIRGSFLRFVAAVGVVCLTLAFTLQDGVLAGMLLVWGVFTLLYAAVGFVGIRLIGYR